MAEKDCRIGSLGHHDHSSEILTTQMEIPLRSVFKRISGCATSWKSNQIPQCHRMFQSKVEEEEFPYANTRCLSSYYSVFVVRLAIMVMLAILIGMLTVLTWHFTRVYTTKSINSLAFSLRYELLQRPILRMWNTINSTAEVTTAQVKLSEYVIRRYSNPANLAEQVELYEAMKAVTWALFASRKALNAITIKYTNGFVQAFHRDLRSNNTFYLYSNLVNNSINGDHDIERLSVADWKNQSGHGNVSAIWYHEPLDPETGEKIGKPRAIPPDDLINIAGLSQVADGVASWHVGVSKYTDSPLLSAALPVWDPSKEKIVAVVGVTTALYSVGQLMKELAGYHSGHMYLTSQEGYLLATSTDAPLLKNSTGRPKLVMATDSEDEVIRLGAQWIQESYGNKFHPTLKVHAENAKLGHQKYYIDSFFLNLKKLPLVGVIIIPRKYIMGKVDQRAIKTLVILISASVCILFIGCVCILILTSGVSKEMKLRAELISHLDARRRAEASSNYKSQFLANMSHELRTPMAAVIGLLDILICDDCLTNEQYSMVTQIRKCSTALLHLLNNILDISKIESGKLVLEEAEFDLGRELEGLVDMFSVQCMNHNVETILDLSDDMPKLVRGDSARVVQIFANLISNSIKFTNSGHIILRGWCERSSSTWKRSLDQKEPKCAFKSMLKQHGNHVKKTCKKENKIVVWFEVEDTGCGIDPSKWESVFESFEQADPSTTRTYGGTGLGLCIVRTLVNKMGGQIKVVKKNGPGTLMRLFLLLGAPPDGVGPQCRLELADQKVFVLLALSGRMGRLIMSRWLRKHGACTWEASDWNELTQTLEKVFRLKTSISNSGFDIESLQSGPFRAETLDLLEIGTSILVVVVDIGLLDLSSDTCKDQLNFLDTYRGKVKFVWMLNHDTSNATKTRLRRRGHLLTVNKPLYKAKMIHIIEDVVNDRNLEMQKTSSKALETTLLEGHSDECHPDTSTSNDSDKSHMQSPGSSDAKDGQKQQTRSRKPGEYSTYTSSALDFVQVYPSGGMETDDHQKVRHNALEIEGARPEALRSQQASLKDEPRNEFSRVQQQNSGALQKKDAPYTNKVVNEQKSLEGLCILLAEDTPVLQRVATIMLEKLGAKVIAVGDGQQAVDALECMLQEEEDRSKSISQDGEIIPQRPGCASPRFDLILMDCQMPKMDGYEATKAIRKSEEGCNAHIPIVALTAHAMSSDEAKCLEVGMDAYLTKPIDLKLMVSTILSLTKRVS